MKSETQQRVSAALPSSKELHELFVEREPGVLYNRRTRAARSRAGTLAGCLDRNGWKIRIGHVGFARARLIWKLHHGTDPIGFIAHINGDTLDDKIENLRDVAWGEWGRGALRGPGSYINHFAQVCTRVSALRNSLRFSLCLWPDEDCAAIQRELHSAIAPIVDRIYAGRRGRLRPPSPRVALPALPALRGGYRRNGR
jgi:hypothetical protein